MVWQTQFVDIFPIVTRFINQLKVNSVSLYTSTLADMDYKWKTIFVQDPAVKIFIPVLNNKWGCSLVSTYGSAADFIWRWGFIGPVSDAESIWTCLCVVTLIVRGVLEMKSAKSRPPLCRGRDGNAATALSVTSWTSAKAINHLSRYEPYLIPDCISSSSRGWIDLICPQ